MFPCNIYNKTYSIPLNSIWSLQVGCLTISWIDNCCMLRTLALLSLVCISVAYNYTQTQVPNLSAVLYFVSSLQLCILDVYCLFQGDLIFNSPECTYVSGLGILLHQRSLCPSLYLSGCPLYCIKLSFKHNISRRHIVISPFCSKINFIIFLGVLSMTICNTLS